MTDYEEEQRNEIEAIESIYPEEFTSKKFPGNLDKKNSFKQLILQFWICRF